MSPPVAAVTGRRGDCMRDREDRTGLSRPELAFVLALTECSFWAPLPHPRHKRLRLEPADLIERARQRIHARG
jgi:hypothetical protein